MAIRAEKKRARRSRTQQDDDKPDRLSDLPDALIHQILSLLELRSAIQTSVLSKRWKYLWASLSDLKFCVYDFTYSKFTKFVRKVLSTRADCHICKFELDCGLKFNLDHSLMKRIINYVVSHGIQHLELRVGDRCRQYHCGLFRPLLTCKTLKTLHLSNVLFENLPESFDNFGFTMLSSLNLYGCKFCYVGGSADPFAGCPNLKNLCLQQCVFPSPAVLKISGIQLLKLKIEYWHTSECKVEIFAPKLASFYIENSVLIDFSSLYIPSLCYADIWFHSNNNISIDSTLVEKRKYGLELINLLGGLYNAEVVRLSKATTEILKWVPRLVEQHPAPFKRLKYLKVEYVGNMLPLPDCVKTYLLGDNPHEETMCVEDSPIGKTKHTEFRKVQPCKPDV